MNCETFTYDLNNLLDYCKYQFCFDNVLYDFKDKYNDNNKNIWYNYFIYYINTIKSDEKKIKIKKIFNIE